MSRVARLWPTIADDTPLDKAEEIRRAARPSDFPLGVLTEVEFMGIDIPEPKFILRELIMDKSIIIINGERGGGKSWLMESIANEVTWGGQIGPWKVEEPVNVMFVDGEMSMSSLQSRLKMMNQGRDVRKKPRTIYLYPESYAYRIELNRASILDRAWREFILEITKRLDVGLLMLDNLSSLAPGIDENDKMAFDPVNRWLMELRSSDVSTVMAHHTGKSGEQRGTTAHEDHVDAAVLVTQTKRAMDTGKCEFVIKPTKDRAGVMRGNAYKMELVDGEKGRKEFEATLIDKKMGTRLADVEGMNYVEAKSKLGISRATYFRAKRRQSHEG